MGREVGNFINHGVGDVVAGAIRGISVDSLASLASFKTGAVSTMHFLCLSLGSADSDFVQGLKQSLSSVHEASKERAALLRSSIEAPFSTFSDLFGPFWSSFWGGRPSGKTWTRRNSRPEVL